MQMFSLQKWFRNRPLLKPKALKKGDTIGIFTPSSPGYIWNEELFLNGIRNIERLGFKTKLGSVTLDRGNQGYRSGTAEAKEWCKDDSFIWPKVEAQEYYLAGGGSVEEFKNVWPKLLDYNSKLASAIKNKTY